MAAVKEINKLHEYKSEEFKEVTKLRYYKDALDTFFKRPIISSIVFAEKSKIESQNTARNILKRLESSGFIKKK
ncbi:hypothetical protein ATZ36_12270 [Candidatus Endomicrobiellum trichonymphae]|uniref:Uncharacterized protein n=1 Tax=Endomicrobium trichonymphae TaxID=1408204 RepID=A0A1E5IMZ0_ENDTX|nr:hypothetical protein ATZ36_12270 [Candidatus Endomicrobium trichonymphae]